MTAHDETWIEDDEAQPDIVEWYEARPVTVSTVAATGSLVGAFALGALVAVGALVVLGRIDLD